MSNESTDWDSRKHWRNWFQSNRVIAIATAVTAICAVIAVWQSAIAIDSANAADEHAESAEDYAFKARERSESAEESANLAVNSSERAEQAARRVIEVTAIPSAFLESRVVFQDNQVFLRLINSSDDHPVRIARIRADPVGGYRRVDVEDVLSWLPTEKDDERRVIEPLSALDIPINAGEAYMETFSTDGIRFYVVYEDPDGQGGWRGISVNSPSSCEVTRNALGDHWSEVRSN